MTDPHQTIQHTIDTLETLLAEHSHTMSLRQVRAVHHRLHELVEVLAPGAETAYEQGGKHAPGTMGQTIDAASDIMSHIAHLGSSLRTWARSREDQLQAKVAEIVTPDEQQEEMHSIRYVAVLNELHHKIPVLPDDVFETVKGHIDDIGHAIKRRMEKHTRT